MQIKCCVILGSVISAESLGVNSVLTQVSLNTWLSRGDATLFHCYFNYGDLFTLSWHLRLLDALGLAIGSIGRLTRRRECGLGIKWKEWSCRVCIYVQHSTVSLMSLLEEVCLTGIEL